MQSYLHSSGVAKGRRALPPPSNEKLKSVQKLGGGERCVNIDTHLFCLPINVAHLVRMGERSKMLGYTRVWVGILVHECGRGFESHC